MWVAVGYIIIGTKKLLVRWVECKNSDIWIVHLEPIYDFFSCLLGTTMPYEEQRNVKLNRGKNG